jgi:hypothetical protein
MAPASATRPDAVTVALFEATWPLLIPIETDAPLLQAAFDEVICTFQAPSKVAAADGVARPSAASSEAAIRDFRDVIMTCPFGLDTIRVSQRRHGDCDCHHPSGRNKKPRVAAGLWLNALAVLAGQLTRVQVWPPQNIPPKAQPWTRRLSAPFSAIVES